MSSKAGFSLEGIKAEFGRVTHKIKEKIGKGDETVDIEYNHAAERFKKTKKDLKNLKESSNKILNSLKELNKCFGIFTESLVNIFPPDQNSHHVILNLQKAMNGLDVCRQAFDESWKDDFLIPLSAYMGVYKEASSRIDERERRRVDLDRFRDDLKDMSEKPQKDPAKLVTAREKMYQQQEAFKDANAELIHDLPILIADAPLFLEPIVGTVVNGFNNYYLGCSAAVSSVMPQMGVLPKGKVDAHLNRQLLTPKEVSAIYKPLTAYLPAAQAKMQEKAAQAAASGGGYNPTQPQPGGAPAPAYPPPYSSGQPGYPPQQPGYPPQQPGYPPQPAYPQPQPQPQPPQPGYPPQQPGYGYPVQQTPPRSASPGGVAARALPTPGARPPPSAPPRQVYAKGVYAFSATEANELSFDVGDVLIIHSQQGSWWEAELNGKRGVVPSNYVEITK